MAIEETEHHWRIDPLPRRRRGRGKRGRTCTPWRRGRGVQSFRLVRHESKRVHQRSGTPRARRTRKFLAVAVGGVERREEPVMVRKLETFLGRFSGEETRCAERGGEERRRPTGGGRFQESHLSSTTERDRVGVKLSSLVDNC